VSNGAVSPDPLHGSGTEPHPSRSEEAMLDKPAGSNAREMDDAQVEALADYLGLTRDNLERLQTLREQVTGTLNQEFAIVAADLSQLRAMLSDAAAKLSGTFRVVTASSDELRRTLGEVQETTDLPVLKRLNTIAEEMASTTGTTVQSLQFEDMATQLLQHVDRKLDVLASLAKDMAVINPTAASIPPLLRTNQLDELFERLESYRTELSVATRKVVQQSSLESGDIELF
jgi:hypothetical protein